MIKALHAQGWWTLLSTHTHTHRGTCAGPVSDSCPAGGGTLFTTATPGRGPASKLVQAQTPPSQQPNTSNDCVVRHCAPTQWASCGAGQHLFPEAIHEEKRKKRREKRKKRCQCEKRESGQHSRPNTPVSPPNPCQAPLPLPTPRPTHQTQHCQQQWAQHPRQTRRPQPGCSSGESRSQAAGTPGCYNTSACQPPAGWQHRHACKQQSCAGAILDTVCEPLPHKPSTPSLRSPPPPPHPKPI